MPTLTNPTPQFLDELRPHLLGEIARRNLADRLEFLRLAQGHIDGILDCLFKHTGRIRVRVGENEFVEILPGGTAH